MKRGGSRWNPTDVHGEEVVRAIHSNGITHYDGYTRPNPDDESTWMWEVVHVDDDGTETTREKGTAPTASTAKARVRGWVRITREMSEIARVIREHATTQVAVYFVGASPKDAIERPQIDKIHAQGVADLHNLGQPNAPAWKVYASVVDVSSHQLKEVT